MKVTFTCLTKTLNLSIDPGRPLRCKFPGGETTVRNVTTIPFRNHQFITEDQWEIKQVREWAKKYPKDGIKELK